jgi:uncharacterized protein
MSVYFVDTSALVKRYLDERGSDRVQQLLDPRSGHLILIAEITRVENDRLADGGVNAGTTRVGPL